MGDTWSFAKEGAIAPSAPSMPKKAAPVRWTCPGHGDRPKITVKGQAIGCFEVGTGYENKHLPCCNTMFQQSEHKEEQKEHKEEQRWEEEEPRTRGRESYVVSRKRAKKLLHPASSGASGAPSGGASGVASGRAFGGASGVASGGARGQASSMGASDDASDDAASSDDHEDTAASLRRISSSYDEYQERRGALEDAAEGRLTDVSTCLRERY